MGRRSRSGPGAGRGPSTGQPARLPGEPTPELPLAATLPGISRPPLAGQASAPAPVNAKEQTAVGPAPAPIAEARVPHLPLAASDTLPSASQPDTTADPAWAATLAGMPQQPLGAPVVSVASFPVPAWERYEFLAVLGRGGMGAVYKARDRRLKREVALKFIHGDDPQMIGRFMQEARAQARIDHENICKVYETGEVEGKPYIAMQLVDGLPLDKACRAMSLNEKAEVIQEVAKALHVAHEQDIIHRDIKPSNIMVERITDAGGATRYRPVLMDFGLARETSAGKGITETGAVMGTPHYMSPEQARGEARRLDRRSDVYSLGATLYELLTGEPPFSDETVVNILLKVMDQDAKPARSHNPAIPVALDTIVSKCLNKEPAQRYPTALALADDLGRFLSAQRIAARRLSYLYRIGYWARRKPAVATLTGALLTSLLCLTGYGLRTRIAQRQQEAQARRDADLAQRLGQTVKDLEWRMRTDYLLPLHNTEREKAAVRTQMAQIEQDLRSAGAHGVRLAHYALGRGHLALHEWQQAQEQLQQAERQGLNDRELDYALGRVLGERYRIALEEARKSGDPSFVAARQKELEQEFLVPARTYLARSRSLASVSPSYIEALIDFYHQRYDAALINAHFAQKQQPNLYEAIKLQGDVHMARALQQKDRGAYDDAEATFQHALAQYGRAAEVGRSDHTLHEAIAEAWVRQEENDMLRGRDPGEKMQQALLAAERALECAPSDSAGWTKKAYAYYFTAQTAQDRGDSATATALYTQQIAAGQAAARLHPEDAYAFESIGVAYESLAQDLAKKDQPISHLTKLAFENFEAAIKNNPRFPWAYNDYASTLMFEVSTYQATDPRIEAMLHRAAALAQQSINIDKSQTNSHIVLSLIYTELSRSLTERGLDSEKYLNMAEGHARDVLKLNPQYFFVFGNLGSLSIVRFIHHVDKNSDGQKDANEAIRCFGEFIRINSKVIGAYRELGRAYALHVGHLLSRGMPAESEIKAGHQVIQNCYRLEKDDAECQVHDALLFSAEAAWLLARRPTLAAPLFERALSIADSAQARLPKSLAASLSMGELGLRILLAEGVERSLRVHAYRSGVSALERALGLSPAWPRAQALLAALLAAGQGLAPSAEAQAQSKERARGLFAQAFVGNPLLKNRYAAMAAALHK